MTCRDAIDVVADFLDQTLSSDAGRALERRLRNCPPCMTYLNTYRTTRGLVAAFCRVEMPAELKLRLRQFLREQLAPPVC